MSTAQPAAVILERLKDVYGEPVRHASGDPITGLVGTILSQSTTDINSERALATLRATFPGWQEVLDSPVGDVAAAIRAGGLADQKAATVKRALEAIAARSPDFDVEFMDDMSDADAMSFMTSMKGVGQKTAACVLMFDLERDVLPVDTHVHRVSRRLGLTSQRANASRAQHELEALIAPEDRYAAHVLMIQHGRKTCRARSPACDACAVSDLCEYALENSGN